MVERFVIDNNIEIGNIDLSDLSCIVDTETKVFYFVVDSVSNIEHLLERLNGLVEKVEDLEEAKKFFEDMLFEILYATSDYQRLILNKEMIEAIDKAESLEELREMANYGIEEFKKDHKWMVDEDD